VNSRFDTRPSAATPASEPPYGALLLRLGRGRALARAILWFEQAWPAFWPPLGAMGLFLCAALLGLPALLPMPLHIVVLIAALAAIAVLWWRAVRSIAAPTLADADRRLEQASGLEHRPLATLTDRPATNDPVSGALWRAHLARAASRIGALRIGLPHPGLPARDPRALRAGLLVAVIACLVIAGGDAPARLADAFTPHRAPTPPAPAAQLEAWVTAPAYTGVAPIILRSDGGPVSVPTGSVLSVSLTGEAAGAAVPELRLADQATPLKALDAGSFQAELGLTQGGTLKLVQDGGTIVAWDLTIIPDLPPTAAFTDTPGAAGNAASPAGQRLRIPWRADDDYGVVSLQAELRLRDRPDAPPVTFIIPQPSVAPKSAHGTHQIDLTPHPWSGLPVIGRLIARDAANQTGESEPAAFTLPERLFKHPLAQALMDLRKTLAVHPEQSGDVADRLEQMADAPDAFGDDWAIFLNLAATAALLRVRAENDEASIDDAQSRMWQLALKLEEGASERTAKSLEAAREAAREALERANREASPENRAELDKKLAELEAAIRNHMDALLDDLRRDSGNQQLDPNAPKLDSRDLEKMAEQARKAAREGKLEDVQKKLAALEKMLERMKSAKAAQDEQEKKRGEQRQRGKQQMSALQDMVQREGKVLDRTQSRAQAGNSPGAPTDLRRQPSAPANGADTPEAKGQREQDRKTQQALRRALGELMQQAGDLSDKVPPSLSDADQAMREAMHALGEGRDGDASSAAQKAIEAMQRGGREMSQQMASQFGELQPGNSEGDAEPQAENDQDSQDGEMRQQQGTQRNGQGQGTRERTRDARRDPLGRRLREGTSGADESADVTVPDQIEQQRARAIQDELRRRGAERTRPQPELDYIDRLLKQF